MQTAIIALLLATQSKHADSGPAKVAELHAELVSQFEDLSPNKLSKFGIDRISVSRIKAHQKGWPKGRAGWEFRFDLTIYGCHGHPLDPSSMELRFEQDPIFGAPGVDGKKTTTPDEIRSWRKSNSDLKLKLATDAIRTSKVVSLPASKDHKYAVYREAHLIRLTKPACLKCHQEMKLNDPVAVVVYELSKS